MTGRERMLEALAFREPDRPPHFELIFEPVEEAFGCAFPSGEAIAATTGEEHARLLRACVKLYVRIIERYRWDALCVWHPGVGPALLECLTSLQREIGDRIMLGGFLWGSLLSIDFIQDYEQFALDIYERPEELHAQAQAMTEQTIANGLAMRDAGAEMVCIASDLAFNQGTLLSPPKFREFITPYLQQQVATLREAGLVVIFHSDGNLMAVLDDFMHPAPHALQSIDPMAGMDIADVKRLTYGKLALMGNVQCSLLQDGPESVIRDSARYALTHGAPGGGYIFSSSNTIFTGVPLRHYDVMLEELHAYAAGARTSGARTSW